MSSDRVFQCPVCRARQNLSDSCRRCRADLRLVAQAHRRVAYLLRQREEARAEENVEKEARITLELQWLSPGR